MSVRTVRRANMDFARLKELANSGSPTISAVDMADENGATAHGDAFHWRIRVMPPAESVYHGTTYDILFTLSQEDYPFKPPAVRVLTRIFNPMVSEDGAVCEGLLHNDDWKPTTPVADVVGHVVKAIFLDYKTYAVLNETAAGVMVTATPEEFKKHVQRTRASDAST
ncbi:UBC6 / ubiquitin-conjugating enzyme E2 [Leishmania donovani]|uniref:Ubiquitin-conjugating_enzyme_E2_-_putative n=3 Tax=Leishmania donovani species complex TaxID=38574 RepID=A0A6L0XNQ2_LEIIN|nr:putative ubiquitin-conjugating enzyme [Leishmania infantum JPCM5]XP_003864328.1 ubiquitin-conjugating enzyme, putative [Leishmania donovani]CAC9538113.1 ubiquitin-conjugating_enzyme_E2_-_putative [Leishmania infantum]AYU82507.1 ubiquitin-conjugating enzyme E2, putative [Leishmania donovani]TPP40077.1 Ubiquitin-conjugating enzyme family protein [Leishmania donovani]TPP50361.1 Ubiquitin-conjugating enzyme family protein [Leishmania donovani]CAJ1992512.1 UBC6 / ubiquitin-conjugating enzyme E2|eukprot:XP_001468536.1 putative ubiquitin-conjugating enzyme [Leishmania infantum JPCM5]